METATPVIDPESNLFRVLDIVADSTNPLLIVWLLVVLVVGTRQRVFTGRTWLAVLLSVAVVYLIKTIDSRFDLWEQMGLDYSTHSALAAALAVSLFFLDIPRRLLAIAVLGAYEVLMVLMGFHTVADIGTTLVAVVPLIVLLHVYLGRKPQSLPVQT